MDFLALAQRLRQECRVSGSGPVAVTGQNAEMTRILTWTAEAWLEIQRSNDYWRFMRASAQCATVNAQPTYSPTADFGLTDFGRWALNYDNGDTFRNYDTAAGTGSEVPMWPMSYDQWRDTYQFGATRTTYSRPVKLAVAPDNSLACGPVPSAGYTLLGDYYRQPVQLTLATDIPAMPEQFHMAIVYLGMQYYGASEAAPEIYDAGLIRYEKIFRQLTKHQAPRFQLAGALV